MKTTLLFCLFISTVAHASKYPLPWGIKLAEMDTMDVQHSLTDYYLNGRQDMDSLIKVSQVLNVQLHSSVYEMSYGERTTQLNEALKSYTRLPYYMLERIQRHNKGLTLVAGKLSNHPALANMGNQRPRGWVVGTKFDDLPGIGATNDHGAIICLDSLHKGHGSVDLVLHEVGHGFDRYFTSEFNLPRNFMSAWRSFNPIMASTPFVALYGETRVAYHRNREENFAELFAMYFHSDESREKLKTVFPIAHDYFAAKFPDNGVGAPADLDVRRTPEASRTRSLFGRVTQFIESRPGHESDRDFLAPEEAVEVNDESRLAPPPEPTSAEEPPRRNRGRVRRWLDRIGI